MTALVEQQSPRRRGEDVEDDFVSPLTMIRGVLEMIQDTSDLPPAIRRLLGLALDDCDRLSESIDRLIEGNPDAVKRRRPAGQSVADLDSARQLIAGRLSLIAEDQIAEFDFSDMSFDSTEMVNRLYDAIDMLLSETGQQWYLMVNYRNCTIAPEAWVAYAHRGRLTNKVHSLGTVRYAVPVDTKPGLKQQDGIAASDSSMFRSRQAAIDYLRQERGAAR